MTAEFARIGYDLLDNYFVHRAEELNSSGLDDLLAVANYHLFCLHGIARVDRLLEALLQERMRDFDKAAFSRLTTMLRTQVTIDSDVGLIQLLQNYSGAQRIVHDEVLARLINRLSREFLQKFSLVDGSIDWDKLVCFAPHASE